MKITARFELIAYVGVLCPILALSRAPVIIEFIPKIVFKVN